jgi:NADH pyrophosphatase NudC (nudix superfamily)
VVKHVSYYVAEAKHVPLQLEKKTGLDDAKWFQASEVPELRMYDDVKPLIEKALEIGKGKGL